MKTTSVLGIVPLLLAAFACQVEPLIGPERDSSIGRVSVPSIDPPLDLDCKAYDAAGDEALPRVEPSNFPGLHNVFQLSDRIVSGSEPEGAAAFETLARMGVRTILSVDGKVPDVAMATRFGMRYVHVPIQYAGIRPRELERIAKTFRELQAPFFVHCFHGKHRGPAAAAVGRVVLDGMTRTTAIAEMRQWMGTSPKYEGLYRTLAVAKIPNAEETRAMSFDFRAAHKPRGMRTSMIPIVRAYDDLKVLATRDFRIDPDHPDTDARNEAEKLVEAFQHAYELDDTVAQGLDYQAWMKSSVRVSARLLNEIRAAKTDSDAVPRAKASLVELRQLCNACHAVHRN